MEGYIEHAEELGKLADFLEHFTAEDNGVMRPKYKDQLQRIANRATNVLRLSMDDLVEHGDDLARRFEGNARRYLALLSKAADRLLPQPDDELVAKNMEDPVESILRSLRRAAQEGGEDGELDVPDDLKRRYEVQVEPSAEAKPGSIREIRADQIGHLVTVRALVTRVTDVKPLVTVATYLTDPTGETGGAKTVFQDVQGMSFMPLSEASGQLAQRMGVKNGTALTLQTRGSKFVKYQEVKVQEVSSQVPAGSIPRTMTIRVRGELTRTVKPGDVVTVSGMFLPEPVAGGYRAMKAGLVARTYLEALHVRKEKETYADQASRMTEAERDEIEELIGQGNLYQAMGRSVAPEIYGHEDIKKALLLLMVGGVTRQLTDGMRLRGDIHMCLMGDPGVAKSQLLKFLCNVAPRSVYTNGRGSSGVGLTAAVTQDPNTNEMVLEGGALVLADNGICCIDEFDKMDEIDRTSIHEVMEQQTVSIAKAGITTTLNARCSVLAAANPAFGRYDLRRSPAENINLPASLLSRFDLLWVVLDKADAELDIHLAEHVMHVHMHNKAPSNRDFTPMSPRQLRSIIAFARERNPTVGQEITEEIALKYASMRAENAADPRPSTYITARSLLSILRVAQAVARLRMSDTVDMNDVEEACRLHDMSKASLLDPEEDKNYRRKQDKNSEVFAMVKEMYDAKVKKLKRKGRGAQPDIWVEFDKLKDRLSKMDVEDIKRGLQMYANLDVLQLDQGYNAKLVLVEDDA